MFAIFVVDFVVVDFVVVVVVVVVVVIVVVVIVVVVFSRLYIDTQFISRVPSFKKFLAVRHRSGQASIDIFFFPSLWLTQACFV